MDKDPLDGLEYYEKYDSITRMRKALDKKYCPINLDREKQSALFKGSASKPYQTTLESCTCPDFSISGSDPAKPCKHMYRLAHELGLCNLNTLIPHETEREEILREVAQCRLREMAKYWEFMPQSVLEEYLAKVINLVNERKSSRRWAT